ncbi:capsular polysaccharide synthesis protein [Limosilactobacillus reuteri]|uniref:capsular polysaccharide synthesis protein n=1 Tax=Limosilactobacillus reuteri TaxID=1598 RepID=UPI001E5177E6|nr:capsular polysaccharide synthesis protein [Limosilactobacillus reuteri]MCC4404976.1 capsular polysaccharide synthesis protein [Limosilactobacillus reuteri]
MDTNKLKLVAKISQKVKLTGISSYFNNAYYNQILRKLDSELRKAKKETIVNTKKKRVNNNVIWFFWWQGINNMPRIVENCYHSLLKHSNRNKVILITKDNVAKYTDISHKIYAMVDQGQITLTHFSDIVRFNLLKNHGGLWCDATIFWVKDITDEYFSDFYTAKGIQEKYDRFISKGRWVGFLIGGVANHDLFYFMNEFFKIYWNNHDKLIDYFLIDIALTYAYNYNIGNFKSYCDNCAEKNNIHINDFARVLNKPFNEQEWKCLCYKTEAFKLSWKLGLSDNKQSFYNKIVNK